MQLFEDIKIITLFTLALFSVFLFSYKKGNLTSNYLLASVYAFQALESLNGTFYRFSEFWINKFPWVFYSTEFTFFLWGPAIYYFFVSAIYPDFKFQRKNLWHLVPAIIHTIFLCYKFHFHSNSVKIELLTHGVMSVEEDFVIHFLKNASVVVYLFLSTKQIVKQKNNYIERNSWLIFFLVVFYIVEIIQILHFIDLETRIYNTIIYNTTSIIWFFIAVTTLYKALRNPYFFSSENNYITTNEKERTDIINSESEFEEILIQINQKIKNEWFLEPELTLQKLADEINCSPKKTSFVINKNFEMNVSDFINSLKIEKAKTLLSSTSNKEKTIIEIAYEVGFNSKATFNRAFAKFTGVSPTQYRKGDA